MSSECTDIFLYSCVLLSCFHIIIIGCNLQNNVFKYYFSYVRVIKSLLWYVYCYHKDLCLLINCLESHKNIILRYNLLTYPAIFVLTSNEENLYYFGEPVTLLRGGSVGENGGEILGMEKGGSWWWGERKGRGLLSCCSELRCEIRRLRTLMMKQFLNWLHLCLDCRYINVWVLYQHKIMYMTIHGCDWFKESTPAETGVMVCLFYHRNNRECHPLCHWLLSSVPP